MFFEFIYQFDFQAKLASAVRPGTPSGNAVRERRPGTPPGNAVRAAACVCGTGDAVDHLNVLREEGGG